MIVDLLNLLRNYLYSLRIWNYFNIIEKIISLTSLKYPNLYKLIVDIVNVYTSNKQFILYYARIYIYVCVLLYLITFLFITVIFFIEGENLIFIGEFMVLLYKFWTFPIKKVRFIMKYLFLIPYNILSFLFIVVKTILSSINEKIKGYTGYCMQKDENFGKSPENGRTSPLDSTEWELNCTMNKYKKVSSLASIKRKWEKAALGSSGFMDYDIGKADKPLKDAYHEFNREWKETQRNHWCPNNNMREEWNNKFK